MNIPLPGTPLFPSVSARHTPLPEGYAIALTADGVFHPLLVSSEKAKLSQTEPIEEEQHIVTLVALRREWETIPFAHGAFPRQGLVACTSWEEAAAWCQRQRENSELLNYWEALASSCELYPERNAWYNEHIHQLLSQAHLQLLPPGINICPLHYSVCAWLTCKRQGKERSVFAEADTIDAVWEVLYLLVWQWVKTLGCRPVGSGP